MERLSSLFKQHFKKVGFLSLAAWSIQNDYLAIVKFISFLHKTNWVCFLFCQINAEKRTVNGGPISICGLVCSLWILLIGLKILSTVTVAFGTPWHNTRNIVVPLISISVNVMIGIGIYSTCNYALKHSGIGRCYNNSFERIDFYTFTPKYVRGFRFPTEMLRSMSYSIIALCIWLVTLVVPSKFPL